MKIYIHPTAQQVSPDTGIGQVIIAQAKHLPNLGFEIVSNPHGAELIVCHVMKGSMPRVDVLHSHGVYFGDIPHVSYDKWHTDVNVYAARSAREAFITTVPSDWVGMVFKRDMHLSPRVVGHGIDIEEWNPGDDLGYVLWNKTRNDDVCDPLPAYHLALKGIPVFSTFMPKGASNKPHSMTVIGTQNHGKMKKTISNAGVYLATTMETFGIGTLEAMACGVPVLGYAWGGTLDLIQHKVNGYLVEPENLDGLEEGYYWLKENREKVSVECRKSAELWAWSKAAEKYARIYQDAIEMRKNANKSVSVVIPAYNYAHYIKKCIDSVKSQTVPVKEIIVVDDGSTDNTEQVVKGIHGVEYIRQDNMGVAFARNTGVNAATGEFIVCLDPDDYLDKNFVKVLAGELSKDRGIGIAYSDIFVFSDNTKPAVLTAHEFDWNLMSRPESPPPNCIPIGSMYRKSMWEADGGYRQIYAPGEDTDFWVRGLALGFLAKKVSQDALFFYNVHPGSASRTKKYKRIDTWKPYMRDKDFPFAAPGNGRLARSYAFPLVSVIIPVGPGHEKYLPSAIESLEGQTFREWEAIIVDDTGKDKVKDYIENYPFVSVIKTTGARGAGHARNIGIDAAKGDLVLFLDADDYIDPEALEKMIQKYVETDGKFYVYSGWTGIGRDGSTYTVPQENYDQKKILIPGKGHAITVLMDRSVAAKIRFDEDLGSFEDVEFFVRCAVNGVCGTLVNEPLLYYRFATGNRRPTSDKLPAYEKEVYSRFDGFVKGVLKMPSCCGGGGKSVLAAKRMLSGLPKTYNEILEEEVSDNMSNLIRMEFIGEEKGTRTFFKKYRGGDNMTGKFADVAPSDVQIMEQTGKWKKVSVVSDRVVPRVEVPIERLPQQPRELPEVGEVEQKIIAATKLQDAKSEFDQLMDKKSSDFGDMLNAMKVYELVEYAEKNGITIDRKVMKNKAQIIEFIKSEAIY